jgi:hypothetical protein
VEENPYSSLELELAVTRSRTYLLRAVFPAGTSVTVGRERDAVVRFDDAILPRCHELFRLGGAGAGLRFRPEMRVEIAQSGKILTTEELRSSGLAKEEGGSLCLPLASGVKGLVRFGELGLLFKVQAARKTPVHATPAGANSCAACGGDLKHVLEGGGALTPCAACGALNEVGGISDDGPPTEHVDDTVSDLGSPVRASLEGVVQPFDDLRTESDPSVSHQRSKGADLPTFDAIQAHKPLSAATGMADEPRKGADLPTFDAISVVRGKGFSTQAAISVLKGGDEPDDPAPAQLGPVIDIAKIGDDDAPVPSAELDMASTAPAVRAVKPKPRMLKAIPGGSDMPDDPVDVIKQQAGLNTEGALEIMRGGGGAKPPSHRTEEVPASAPAVTPEPDLFSEEFSKSTRARDRSELSARGGSLPSVNAVAASAPKTTRTILAVGGGDDFLMGRTDLDPGELAPSSSGVGLYAVGLIAGAFGIVLIVLRLLN